MDEKVSIDHPTGNDRKGFVWPRLYISLSSKEKEEDFMAMKGCKLPQRPKKRAKLLQKSLVVSVLSYDSCFDKAKEEKKAIPGHTEEPFI